MIDFFNTLPPLLFSLLMFVTAYASVVLFAKWFGKAGLMLFIGLAVIAANIQVLKVTQFGFFSEPVALGTELFAATYLATDVLTEMYGPKAARQGVFAGFAAMMLWTLITLITLAFAPVAGNAANDAMRVLFTPAPVFLVASVISYLVSQFNDIYIFSAIKKITGEKMLWLRNNISTLVSALIDSAIFSTLAFFIFPRIFPVGFDAVSLRTLIFTYILGTYAFRAFSTLIDTPFMYMAKAVLLKKRAAEQAE